MIKCFGVVMVLMSVVYYFLSSNLKTIDADGKETDGLGRVVESTFVRDMTDKGVMLFLFAGGIWLWTRD